MPGSDFIVVLTPPKGPPEFMPWGFGFTAHAHVMDRALARGWFTEADAWRSGRGYISPPAFWNSEREHKRRMEEKFRGWTLTVERREPPATVTPGAAVAA